MKAISVKIDLWVSEWFVFISNYVFRIIFIILLNFNRSFYCAIDLKLFRIRVDVLRVISLGPRTSLHTQFWCKPKVLSHYIRSKWLIRNDKISILLIRLVNIDLVFIDISPKYCPFTPSPVYIHIKLPLAIKCLATRSLDPKNISNSINVRQFILVLGEECNDCMIITPTSLALIIPLFEVLPSLILRTSVLLNIACCFLVKTRINDFKT